jgi:hypothetical protein
VVYRIAAGTARSPQARRPIQPDITVDEADDSIPDDVASEQFARFTRETPKASLQPLGARRATAPMRRRQDLPFSWEVAAGSHADTMGLLATYT